MEFLRFVFFIAFVSTINCRTVRRNVGAGSAANGLEPSLFFPVFSGSTPEPTTGNPILSNTRTPDPRLELLYKELGCLNVGSSAEGNYYQHVFTFEGETVETLGINHLPDCFVPIPACHDKVDLVFLLDSSGSVGKANFEKEKQFIQQSLARFIISPNDAQIGVVMYSNQPENQFDLNRYTDTRDIVASVNVIPYKAGGTYTSSALQFALSHSFSAAAGARADARQVLVVITDGKSTDPAQTLIAAANLKQDNISIIAVGIGDGVDQSELNSISSGPGYVLRAGGFDALRQFYGTIHELSCVVEITTTPEPTTPEPTTTIPTTTEEPTRGSTQEPTRGPTGPGSGGSTVGPGNIVTGATTRNPPGSGTGQGLTNAPNNTGNGTGTGSSVHQSGHTGTDTSSVAPGAGGSTVAPGAGGSTPGSGAGTGSSSGKGSTAAPNTGSRTTLTAASSNPNVTPDTSIDVNSTSDCVDIIDCRAYLPEKICPQNSTYRAWAEVRCKVYCGFCDPHTSPKPCIDAISNCNEYGDDLCTNPLYRLFRNENCEKFCGVCHDTNSSGTTAAPGPSGRDIDDETEDLSFF